MKYSVILVAFCAIMMSCEKTNEAEPVVEPPVCELRGEFRGTATSHAGNSSLSTYTFKEDNFVTGTDALSGNTAVVWGGYRNTCDSVFISTYYQRHNAYFQLKARISNDGKRISGTFQSLTNAADYGTFTVDKQ